MPQPAGKDLAATKLLDELSDFNSSDEKMERLRNIDLFILDNSVRETTVAQIRGHTMEDKYKILNMVSGCDGFENIVIGTFGSRPKIDDLFAKDCCGGSGIVLDEETAESYSNLYLYCLFAEVRDVVIDGIPSVMTPVAIKRAQEYRIEYVRPQGTRTLERIPNPQTNTYQHHVHGFHVCGCAQ